MGGRVEGGGVWIGRPMEGESDSETEGVLWRDAVGVPVGVGGGVSVSGRVDDAVGTWV